MLYVGWLCWSGYGGASAAPPVRDKRAFCRTNVRLEKWENNPAKKDRLNRKLEGRGRRSHHLTLAKSHVATQGGSSNARIEAQSCNAINIRKWPRLELVNSQYAPV